MFPQSLITEAEEVLTHCRRLGVRLATAESCTGGLIAGLLTEIAGSSDVVECGFVTYSNRAKHAMLGVSEALLSAHGAVSGEVAEAMAQGALAHSKADIAVAVTGIAGPGGATPGKPVGLVFLACAQRGGDAIILQCHFSGTRQQVRLAAVSEALRMIGTLSR